MSMKKNNLIYIIVGFILLAFITGYIYHRGKHRHPFRYELDLPDLNEWYHGLIDNGGDHFVINFVDGGPYDFTNDTDLGRDSLVWTKKEDEYFIVYYPRDMDPRKGSYLANRCLDVAHEAIPDLERTMGKYYYPADVMDNRKLGIYLPQKPSDYGRVINELFGSTTDSEGSIGMTVATVTQCGAIVEGIVIHPSCFEADAHVLNGYRTTLRHEMSHYVYFMSVDYGVIAESRHPLWVSEGIADFIGRSRNQVSGADSIQFIAGRCDLNENFPQDGPYPNSYYWAGESFYKFISDSIGRKAPAAFISTLYHAPVESGLAQLFPNDNPKEKWLESLRQNDTLRHPEYLSLLNPKR